jgi:hypothetical protein
VSVDEQIHAQESQATSSPSSAEHKRRAEYALVGYLAVAVIALVAVRATVDRLDFLGTGWLVVLAVIPLAPVLLPRLGGWLKAVLPYVSSFKVGAVQLDLREARRDPISLVAPGMIASVPNDMAPFHSTGLDTLARDLERLRRAGGAPVVIIDLRDGVKWRRANLYLFARLLTDEPVAQLVFTETRGGRDGYLLGTCPPADVVHQLERTIPSYAAAVTALDQPPPAARASARSGALTLAQRQVAQISRTVQQSDPVYLSTAELSALLGPLLSTEAVDGLSDRLTEEQLRTVVDARIRYVPVISSGVIFDVIDRNSVALAVARTALHP